MCTTAEYARVSGIPWNAQRTSITSAVFAGDMAGVGPLNMCYWFNGCSKLKSVTGWENLKDVCLMKYTFSNDTALPSLDLRGFDGSGVTDWGSCFGSCSSLTTITVDPTWSVSASASGFGMFSGCKMLVGGNGTAYDSSKSDQKMMVIDKEGQPGYLTAG